MKDLDDGEKEVLGGFNDSNPENTKKAREILRQLKADWAREIKLRERDGRIRKERSESTRNRFLDNRRAARQGRQEQEFREEEDNDELLEQYHEWKIQGHREDDINKYQVEGRLNPELVREEFLPPQQKEEDDYSDLPTFQDLQIKQREEDERMRPEEIEDMKIKLTEAQTLLRGKPDEGTLYGGQTEGFRKAATEQARPIKDVYRKRKNLINKHIKIGGGKEKEAEVDRVMGEIDDVDRVIAGRRASGEKGDVNRVLRKEVQIGLKDVRPSYEKRQGQRKEKQADLGRKRARQEKRIINTAGMMAIKIADERGLDLEQERKLEEMLAGFAKKGLSLEDLGRRDVDQIVAMAAK